MRMRHLKNVLKLINANENISNEDIVAMDSLLAEAKTIVSTTTVVADLHWAA